MSFTKLLSLLVVLLSAMLFYNAQQIKQKDTEIELLLEKNTQLTEKVGDLTVNIKSVVAVNARLNTVIAEQNLAIKEGAALVLDFEKKQKKNKLLIAKLQQRGKTFALNNNSRMDNAEENIAYLLMAVPYLLAFDPTRDDPLLEIEVKNGSGGLH